MSETTATIAEWAIKTFGNSSSFARIAARANEEMAELLQATTSGASPDTIREEIADIVIVLARLSYLNGGDIWKDVEKKMVVNRSRSWKLDGTGHGQHTN